MTPENRIDVILRTFVAFTFVIWILQKIWNRRRLYLASLKLPGPLALPFIGSAFYFLGNPHDIFDQITQMFDRYPGIFRVWFGSRLFYAVSNPKYIEILLTNPQCLKKEKLYALIEPIVGQGLFTARSVSYWKKHRKIIMPTFNQRILDSFVEIFAEQSEILCRILKKFHGKGEIEIFRLVSACSLDILSETAMGIKVNTQSSNEMAPNFSKWVDRVMEITMIRVFNIFYHNEMIFNMSSLGREFHEANSKIRSFVKKILNEKKRLRNLMPQETFLRKKVAFLDLLLNINDQENVHFSDDELLDETITFMIGGTDTTATTNCFVLTMLGMHQEIQQKVFAEILDVVGPIESVKCEHLSQLKYLERVIKETLRLFPVGPYVVRYATETINLGDYIIEKGCSIFFGIRNVHMNEKYWPDPYKFDPNRFLPEEIAKRPPASYIPFCYGPRNCIGMNYGMMVMKALLTTILQKYKVFTSYKHVRDIDLKTNLMLRPNNGYKIALKLRN
ncbi:hypothetical protein ABEB36_006755 [Hypothenemus hampei]|uniref:Cytochrome P450 n=1 Tax=Hypothenemus hampei TaxID=57062 RepID=A0ABD1ERM8_HYPHA